MLCKYGIEYVDDPATGKKIPTCHRSSFDSILEDSDFDQAMENADPAAQKIYREEAKQFERIRKGILEVSATEKAYDIFNMAVLTENIARVYFSIALQYVDGVSTTRFAVEKSLEYAKIALKWIKSFEGEKNQDVEEIEKGITDMIGVLEETLNEQKQ